jgi:hypothetical protein
MYEVCDFNVVNDSDTIDSCTSVVVHWGIYWIPRDVSAKTKCNE